MTELLLHALAPAGVLALCGVAGIGAWLGIRQQELLRVCQSRPSTQPPPADLGELVQREAAAGVWEGSYGFRTHATLMLNADGTFRAELVALNLLGNRAVATATASGHWLVRRRAVLFSVGHGVPGLPFASGTLRATRVSGSLRLQTHFGPLQLYQVHRPRLLRAPGDRLEAWALG